MEIKYIYDDCNDDACGNAALSATSICTSSFAEHEKVVLKRKRHKITSQNDGRQNDSPKSVDIKLSSWKLDCETSEIVVPLLLPYLVVKQRVMCQSVCKLWKSIIRKWGVATSIDVADPSFANFNRSLLQGIINHSYYSLHTLVLNDFRDLREEDLLPAIPHLRKLRNLDISRCTLITDITLLKISLHLFDTIEVLYMKGLKKVSDIGMNSVCDHCWRLRVLELSEVPITDDSGINIGNKLTRLEALYMRDNFRLTNKSIDVITSRCHKLSQLTLWGCMRVYNLSINIENLVLLNLWGCHGLSDSAAENMTVLVNLRSLILSECHRLTDKFIFTLATAVPQLYHLHLRYLRRITDASICCIASNMMNIYTLDLTFCTKISSRAITDLIAVRPNLSEVRLSSCRQISEEGAYTILREASKAFNCLSILDLQNCFDSDDIDADNEAINTRISRAFKDVGFTEKVTGFFFRPVVWSSELKDRIEHQILESTIGVDIKRRTSDADLIYGLDR